MNIVAIDTSSRKGAVCLSASGSVAGVERFGLKDSHLVSLGRSIDSLLAKSGFSIENVDRIAIVSGPGSFTGLRIGMAFVKGIYAAVRCEVVIMTSLELLALPLLERSRRVCSIIDARKNEVYAALYLSKDKCKAVDCEQQLPARVLSPPNLIQDIERTAAESVLFTGSGVPCCRELIEASSKIQASFAADGENNISLPAFTRLAAELTPLPYEEVLTLEPFYIRSSDAELKRLKSHRIHERN
jgi:tRNA threonylcarbamoyladenosine biosynthesis protein TsaB